MLLPAYYADTSVVGARFDKDFHEATVLFWEQAREERYRVLVSALVARELLRAPDTVKRFFDTEVARVAELVELTVEMEELAETYLRAEVVPVKFRDDAVHVAAATVSRCRALVSWNFRHLVNIRREDAFNSVNMLEGYPAIRIVSPWEVIEYAE